MLIGYARTSTVDQVAGLEAQEAALAATGCTKLFTEQASSVGQRDQLDAALDYVREGDALVVTRLDRLARSTADLLGIVAMLEGKKVALRILDFGGSEVDTRSPTGRMLLTMFAAVAEFERAIMLERQRAGVARGDISGGRLAVSGVMTGLAVYGGLPGATVATIWAVGDTFGVWEGVWVGTHQAIVNQGVGGPTWHPLAP